MGRRSRAERRAARKTKRANRKLKRADKREANGNTKRAEALRKRAAVLKKKSATIKSQINGQVIRGLSAQIVEVNSLGNYRIKANWNFQQNELTSYDKLYLTLAPASPLRSSSWKQEGETTISANTLTFKKLTKNLRYTVKLFGSQNGTKKLLDRTFVKKNK